ncbi:protein draper-like [Saccostrea echinata]|uniref:protein draper-like n=1 Tax=Saccostrea echinata TaxID=191078 RepID=UPI002A81B928|nr:protein draper-like [Saccostrea echinata]
MQSSKNDQMDSSPTRATDMDINTCSSTNRDNPAWWYVDLQNVKSIHDVQIYFDRISGTYEQQQRQRMYGFHLFITNTTEIDSLKDGHLCYNHSGPDLPDLTSTHVCVTFGRYVFYYNERLPDVTYPDGSNSTRVQLCEVIVHACPKGTYGRNCYQNCSGNCLNETSCNRVTGFCDEGCLVGYRNEKCDQECPNGTYGIDCMKNCSGNCINNETCSKVDGGCANGCATGFQGYFCTCTKGTYGGNCSQNCSGNCLNGTYCNWFTGFCDEGCLIGYRSKKCDQDDISKFKEARQSSRYEDSEVFSPDKAVDKDISTCSSTGADNPAWWYVDLQEIKSIHDIEIYFNGSQTTASADGTFGIGCSKHCSGNCLKGTSCNIVTGECDEGCSPGYVSNGCDQECPAGRFGKDCIKNCSGNCANNETCNNVNGMCVNGCQTGFQGLICDENV